MSDTLTFMSLRTLQCFNQLMTIPSDCLLSQALFDMFWEVQCDLVLESFAFLGDLVPG